MSNKKIKILFLLSHPIQYLSPLFKKLNTFVMLKVIYCSKHGLENRFVREIGHLPGWDIPLLKGYKYKFLKNYSLKPSIFSGFFGLMNFGIISEMKKEKYDAVIVNGWHYFTHVLAVITAKLLRIKVMLRGDNPLSQEYSKPIWKRLIKKIILKQIFFKFIDYFLYVGQENKEFYKYYGVPDKQLIFAPHSVDNERFYKSFTELRDKKKELRKEFGIPEDKIIILFVGKLIDKKRPLDLLNAYEKITSDRKTLIYVGDGYLKKDLEKYAAIEGLNDVYFLGFKNQTELPQYYVIADIFVLPSSGETWGLVVNEAMNFGLPVVVSDIVGCSKDIVKYGENGFIFKMGDVNKLAEYLEILIKDKKLRKKFGGKSLEIIKEYSYDNIIKGIMKALDKAKLP